MDSSDIHDWPSLADECNTSAPNVPACTPGRRPLVEREEAVARIIVEMLAQQ
jgi:hypothetical protein